MRVLAGLIAANRASACAAVSLFAIGAWYFSPLSLLSSAAVGLITLRSGAKTGLWIMVWALLLTSAGGWLIAEIPWAGAQFLAVQWLPIWLTGLVLRAWSRLAWALLTLVGMAWLVVIGFYLLLGDPEQAWLDQLHKLSLPPLAADVPRELILRQVARYFSGLMAAAFVVTQSISLLIARWWQAVLWNPGGFRAEFTQLRLPPRLGFAGLGLLLLAIITDSAAMGGLFLNLFLPLWIPYWFVGFAVIHAIAGRQRNGHLWLPGIYVALVLFWPILILISLIGFSDPWADWRSRVGRIESS